MLVTRSDAGANLRTQFKIAFSIVKIAYFFFIFVNENRHSIFEEADECDEEESITADNTKPIPKTIIK